MAGPRFRFALPKYLVPLLALSLACQDQGGVFSPPAAPGDPVQPVAGQPQAFVDTVPQGRWSAPFPWVNVAVHLSTLPDGRVLSFGRINGGTPQVWNPVNGSFTAVNAPSLLFCAGSTFLSTGQLFVAGGHIQDGRGLPNANRFLFGITSWLADPAMARGRWYPTTVQLGNDQVVVLAGTDQNGATVGTPEVFTANGSGGGTWRQLTGAVFNQPYYPRAFLAPNGQVYYAGELRSTYYLNPAGTGSWSFVNNRVVADRFYGAAVMYNPGRILYVGGGDPPTATAEIVDLSQASPQWQLTGSMAHARQQLNATLLPTGEVFVTGGTSAAGFSNMAGAVLASEKWDPATGQWTTWASSAVPRGYHATAVLLPDGRVLYSGSGDAGGLPNQVNAELFSPPYLFRGYRPTISSLPTSARYGATVTLGTPDAATITNVNAIKLSSTTHAFDMSQRFIRLAYTVSGNTLRVRVPSGRNVFPPGHWMIFILDANGTPSVAKMLRVY